MSNIVRKLKSGRHSTRDLEYNHIFGTLVQQREIAPVLSRMLELREELLEIQRLPVGQNMGPDSVVTNV